MEIFKSDPVGSWAPTLSDAFGSLLYVHVTHVCLCSHASVSMYALLDPRRKCVEDKVGCNKVNHAHRLHGRGLGAWLSGRWGKREDGPPCHEARQLFLLGHTGVPSQRLVIQGPLVGLTCGSQLSKLGVRAGATERCFHLGLLARPDTEHCVRISGSEWMSSYLTMLRLNKAPGLLCGEVGRTEPSARRKWWHRELASPQGS
jgi:hypothetical protein